MRLTGELIGEYFPNIDSKGRMSFPSRFREELGERLYITRWLEDSLAVFSDSEWTSVCEKIKALPSASARKVQLYLFPNACAVEPDKQGRISIPQNLRERVGLTGDVAVIGMSNKVEIWDKQRWTEKCDAEIRAEVFDSEMLGFEL